MTVALLMIAAAFADPDPDRRVLHMREDQEPIGVVGGEPAAADDWPDAAAIYWGSSVSCTGVLVAPTLVLTAGHCEGNITQVTVGTNDYEVGGETLPVAEFFAHPDYNGTYDVTAIVLSLPSTVTPRPLALDCVVEDYLIEGGDVAIVGFGATDEWAGQWGTVLNEAFTEITDPLCEDIAADCNAEVSPGGELIAGGDGIDSCNGDSGGPLYLLTPRGDYLAGLTSRGVVPSATPCGGGGIYVRADAVVDWVQEVTGIALPRPECEGINRSPSAVASDIQLNSSLVGTTTVVVTDPNAEDSHSFSVEEPPTGGTIAVSSTGAVVYTASIGSFEDDEFSIRVEDDGVPPLEGFVRIHVDGRVVPRRIVLEPAGCSTAGGSNNLWILAFLLLYRRCYSHS